ncbi:MAG TPA: sugar ABC transporter permease [Bacteroidetes bacterium]|nr:sugar ABC transporter permease [Bacteroidota bacterium]
MKTKYFTVFIYLLPSLIFLGIFTYYPIFDAFRLSLYKADPFTRPPVFQWFQNYIDFFHNPTFWEVITNNIVFAVATIFPTMILALVFAILINEIKYKSFFRLSLFYPLLIPYAAAAMVWVFMYDPSLGPINKFLSIFGVPEIGWLGDRRYSLWAIIIMTIWKNVGYYMLIYLAGLQNIPKELYDAAKTDGATWLQQHLNVTVPLIGPSTLFIFVVSIIQSFKVFTQIYLMTEGGPGYSSNVLIYYTYEYAFKFWQLGNASALTSIMILVLLFLVLIVFGIFGRRITYQVG